MSALEGEGVKELRELLAGRCSAVFIGSHMSVQGVTWACWRNM